MKITEADLNDLKDKYEAAKTRIRSMREKGEAATVQIVQTLEVGGTAFGFGVMQGRTGGVEVVGVPVDLGAAFLLHGAGFLGAAGGASEHLHNIGDGAAASYLNTLGVGIGARMRAEAERAAGGTGTVPAPTALPGAAASRGTAAAGAMPLGAADRAMAAALANMQRAA